MWSVQDCNWHKLQLLHSLVPRLPQLQDKNVGVAWEWGLLLHRVSTIINEGPSVHSLRNKLLTTAGSKLPNSLDVGFVSGTSASLNIEGNNVVCRERVGSSLVSQLF